MSGGKIGQRSKKVVVILIAIVFFSSFNFMQVTTSGESEKTEMLGSPAGWSDDTLITPYRGTFPAIAMAGSNVHILYDNGSNGEIYYARSIDNGISWDKNGLFTPDDIYPSRAPDLISCENNVHVVWNDIRLQPPYREIFYQHSADNGDSWDPEFNLSLDDSEDSQNPSIACSGQNVHVVWADYRNCINFNVYYKRSIDGGITWDDGLGNVGQDRQLTFINDIFEMEGPAGIAVSGSHVHMLSTYVSSDNVRHAMYHHSPDNGATWDPEIEIGNDPLSAYPGGFTAEGSTVHAVWRGFKDGHEVYYRNSTDYGASWNPEIRLTYDSGNKSWQPDVAVNASHVFVTWMDDRDHYDWTGSTSGAFELYCIESFDGGSTWGPETRLTYAVNNSIQPCVAMDADNIHIAWTDNRTNGSREQIFYKRFPDFADVEPPSHTNETPLPDSCKDAPGTNVSVHVTDPSDVNESTIQLWVNGSLVVHTMTPITDGYNVSYESPGFDPGVVECRIVADDNCSNTLDFTWNFTVLALYEVQLQEGWNLISLPFEQTNESIEAVLSGIDGKYDRIMAYDPLADDRWKSYNINKPVSLNELSELNHKMGFWINITEPNVNLTVRGNITSFTSIPLYAGWNLVGYPSQTTETVANAFFGTGADRVEVCNISEPYLIKEVGPTYVMKPGEGYWVHVAADSVWTVN